MWFISITRCENLRTQKNKDKKMGFRDQVKNSEARRQSEYFSPGRYLVEIRDFKEGENRNGREFVVLETSVLDAEDKTMHPKGAERTWLQMTDQDAAPRNIRGFLCKALNVPDTALSDEMIDAAFESDADTGRSPLSGLKLCVHAREIITKRGTPFTLCDFVSVDQDATEI